ncbi:CDP-alcohol phosphatidyltransferase family protein [Streptomyces sp. YIM 98790]|uniref:CDP-alcohol phosphatidyltransferase family protein n=1 Tax=Streptomyces sp. YIM 98790 TaxID=2689077 RepID=UPI00140E6F45|nr:CDP-alcohol phosphatidyltransferase family protein [Streptomyces sp. YIM 98790]
MADTETHRETESGARPHGADGAGRTPGPAPRTFRAALAELSAAQKTPKGVSYYTRYVNRRLGRVLAAAACRAGLTPHQVTVLSALCTYGGIAAVALVRPSWALAPAVWAALVLGFALDSADGQLARLRRASSVSGEWLDHVVDCGKMTLLHAAVLISFYRFFDLPGEGWLLVPLAFQLAAVVTFCGGLLTEKLKPRPAAGAAGQQPVRPSRVRAVALLPVDYGVTCAVFLLLGNETAFRTGYAALCAVHVLFCLAFLAKWYRELSVPPAPAP